MMPVSSYTLPVIASVLLHVLLVAVLAWGWQPRASENKQLQPRYVEAKLVSLKPKTTQQAAAKKQTKKVDLAAKRRQQERKKREAEKQRAAQRKAQQAAKKAAQAERAEAERRQQEQRQREAQRLADEQRQQRELEASFDEALSNEDEFLQAETDEVTARSYTAAIAARIEQNWSRPPSARKGMQCELRLQLVPTGKVIDVTVVKGSGNAAFDRSAEQAVRRAEQFPELQQLQPAIFEAYFRQLRLVFNPKDLRL